MFGATRKWSEQTVIKHPWHEVMKSVQFKYPNPYNSNVLNIDVLSREVDSKQGVMRSCKLINSAWPMVPHLGHLKAIEYSCIQIPEKRMTSRTINLDLRGVLDGFEDMEYSVHPENSDWTLLRHTISVNAFSLIAISALSVSKQAAHQGLSALQWVINHRLPVLHATNQEVLCSKETITTASVSDDVNAYLSDSTLSNTELPSLANPLDNPRCHHTFILGNHNQSMKSSASSDSLLQKPFRTSSFFADLPSKPAIITNHSSDSNKSSLSLPTDTSVIDSPLNYLESHLETFSRDVTAMTDALVRRSQRVARLFSRIDEYVVIM